MPSGGGKSIVLVIAIHKQMVAIFDYYCSSLSSPWISAKIIISSILYSHNIGYLRRVTLFIPA